MKLIVNTGLNLLVFLFFDAIWMKTFGSAFYAKELAAIGRFSSPGEWDIRIPSAVLVYVLMAFALEVFVLRNQSLKELKSTVLHGTLLGFIIYGVFDFTNRAIVADYSIVMVVVDIGWGSVLFTAVTYVSYQLRTKLTLL